MPLGFYLGSLASVRLPGPTQLDGRSPLVAASAWLAVLIIPLVLVRLYTHVRYLRQTGRGLLKHIWSPHVATTMIGITFVVTMAVRQSWTYSEVLSDLAHGMTSGLFAKMLLGIALLVGATAGGVTAGRFKIVKPDLASMARHLVGGTLMGVGGLLIPGGNTGLALVGLPEDSQQAGCGCWSFPSPAWRRELIQYPREPASTSRALFCRSRKTRLDGKLASVRSPSRSRMPGFCIGCAPWTRPEGPSLRRARRGHPVARPEIRHQGPDQFFGRHCMPSNLRFSMKQSRDILRRSGASSLPRSKAALVTRRA
jgi:hypothetical protein